MVVRRRHIDRAHVVESVLGVDVGTAVQQPNDFDVAFVGGESQCRRTVTGPALTSAPLSSAARTLAASPMRAAAHSSSANRRWRLSSDRYRRAWPGRDWREPEQNDAIGPESVFLQHRFYASATHVRDFFRLKAGSCKAQRNYPPPATTITRDCGRFRLSGGRNMMESDVHSSREGRKQISRYVAFLRAINVGGHTVKMDALRRLFESRALPGSRRSSRAATSCLRRRGEMQSKLSARSRRTCGRSRLRGRDLSPNPS